VTSAWVHCTHGNKFVDVLITISLSLVLNLATLKFTIIIYYENNGKKRI